MVKRTTWSSLRKKHPGGKIIEYYLNQEASDAFDAFHSGSKLAYRMLQDLPHTKSDREVPEVIKDFHKLKAEWRKKGLFKRRYSLDFAHLVTILAMMYYAFNTCSSAITLSGVIMGAAWAQCGFLQHNAGHREIFGNSKWDLPVQLFVETFLKGGSAFWWRNRHNKHHAKTNINPLDTDLRTTPLMAWDDKLAKRCPKWLLTLQHLSFIPFLSLYVIVFWFTTKLFMYRKKQYVEMAVSFLHYVVFWSILSNKGLSMLQIAYWFYIGYAVQGVYLGYFFSLSHFAMPVLHDKDADINWVSMHVDSTLNYGKSQIISWIAGHLNYQIEHHLVLDMPSYNYHRIAGDVERLCKKHGIGYHNVNIFKASYINFSTLYKVGHEGYEHPFDEVFPSLKECQATVTGQN